MTTSAHVDGLLATAYAEADLDKLNPGELEELAAEIARRKAEPDTYTEVVKRVEKLLKAYYKSLSGSLGKEVLLRIPAEKAGLRPLPKLPQAPSSIGDVNLLMTDVPLVRAPFSDALIRLASELVELTKGTMPDMGVRYIVAGMNQVPCMIARWEIPRVLSADELHTMLQLMRASHEKNITGYKSSGDGWQVVAGHQDSRGLTPDSSKQGIYIGPSNSYSASADGLFVYRKFKNKAEADHLRSIHPVDWLARFIGNRRKTTTVIELVNGGKQKDGSGLGQDMFLMQVIQMSYLLRHRALIESAPLWTTIFRELNKIGTKPIDRKGLYGTEQTLGTIERVMLLPYEKPEIAEVLRISGESVLLVGVPGVGKTLLEHYLMASDYNAIFAAVDSDSLRADLTKAGDGELASSILMRVDSIIRRSTLPVILIIDDIDVILKEDGVVSKFLNMMQGIRQKGLLVFASTNYPEKIDPRLLEPGRLSKVVHVPLPKEEDRFGVLMVYLKHLPFQSDEERDRVGKTLAARTHGWSHRYLWELIQDASRFCAVSADAHPCLTLEHFDLAFPELEVRVSLAGLEEWDGKIQRMVEQRAQVGFGKR